MMVLSVCFQNSSFRTLGKCNKWCALISGPTAAMTEEKYAEASKCFLCDEVSDLVVWRENGYEGRLCRCGMLYTNQFGMVTPLDPALEHHVQEFYSTPAELKARWTAHYCPPGRLLEIGCGDGYFLAAAREHGYQVCGIEPNLQRTQRVREQFDIDVEEALLENSNLPRASFDVVYHCDLLAHFPDPIRELSRMVSFLRPPGVLCFEVGILGGFSPLWYKLIGQIGLGPHLWLYSEQALKALFAKSDLIVERVQNFGLAPECILGKVSGIFSRRVLRPLLRSIQPFRFLPSPEAADTLHHSVLTFLRYRIGYMTPRVGPQTLFVMARPRTYATPY
jgi:SAM-dependent methyltransferase